MFSPQYPRCTSGFEDRKMVRRAAAQTCARQVKVLMILWTDFVSVDHKINDACLHKAGPGGKNSEEVRLLYFLPLSSPLRSEHNDVTNKQWESLWAKLHAEIVLSSFFLNIAASNANFSLILLLGKKRLNWRNLQWHQCLNTRLLDRRWISKRRC